MFTKRSVVTCGMLAWLTASAWAGTIQDPAAQIDAGSASNPFTGTGSFPPGGDPGTPVIIALYNATNGYLTSITLDTTIATGLPDLPGFHLDQVFTCNASPFFRDCAVTYSDSTGALSIFFFDAPGEFNQVVCIPPLAPGCLPPTGNPDGPGCTGQGHFAFDFLDPGTGVDGWTQVNTTLFPDGTPTFSVTSTDTAAPEPGTFTLLAAGLLSLALVSRRNYFSRSSRS